MFENYVTQVTFDGKLVELALWDTAGQERFMAETDTLTGSLPLVLVHLALALRVDNFHVLEHWAIFGMLLILGVNFVEFLFVYQVEIVFGGESAWPESAYVINDRAQARTLRSCPSGQRIRGHPQQRP